jgi:asparagine synthase (glutamine-hydrolysing)
VSAIAAIYERDGAPAGEARIAAMLGRLRRRGPDRGAHHVDGSAALAQTMLETTPEDAFDRQPLRSRSGQRWIVADARIDNPCELLALPPSSTAPELAGEVPDAELILRAYERWGEACPERLLGDFAFAIWDGERRRFFCARDHVGVRQLYYHHDVASFRCATEMHALFADDRITRRPHRPSMALFLAYEYAERDETLYEGVHALPPGHAMVVTASALRRRCFWRPDPRRTLPACSDDEYAVRFRDVFSEAVRCRLRAGRPLAAQVSGGLDSSSVACEAERLRRAGTVSGSPLMLMRALFPGLDCDERPYSQAVADHLGLPIATCYPVDQPHICALQQVYPDLYFHPTTTMLDPLLGDLRRRGVRVVLTGTAGDLLMQPTGYEGTHSLRRGRLGPALAAVGLGSAPLSGAAWRRLASQSFHAFAPLRLVRLNARRRHPAKARWPWLSRGAADLIDAHLAQEFAETRSLHSDPLLAELCRGVTHGVGNLLPMALDDRAGASHALEYRHPFCDVRVVELLLALPSEQRFTREQSKQVLRRAMGSALPSLVRDRRNKAEFSSYVQQVFLEGQRGALQRLFRASRLEELGLVDAGALQSLLGAPPRAQRAMGLANLTAMELWLRSPIERTIEAHSSEHHEDRHEHA